jgi:hypothetical protein
MIRYSAARRLIQWTRSMGAGVVRDHGAARMSSKNVELLEASMEEGLFRYERAGTPERGVVIIEFRRPEGRLVEIFLTVDDANRMCNDLREQISIATTP